MSNCLRKWRLALITFILIVTPIAPTRAASVELPLNQEKSFIKQNSQLAGENLNPDTPSPAFSGIQALKSLYTAVKSGLKAVVDHPTRTLMLGLAMLPTANAFSVSNLNQTIYYTYQTRGASTAFLPIIISNASSSDKFNVVIRQENAAEGNITCTGRAPINPSYSAGIWNVTGFANDVNALASQLFFSNDYNANAGIYLYPQVTDIATGQSISGQIEIDPNILAASNLPQFKNYTRNGGGVLLDPIVIKNSNNNIAKVRFSILKEAGDLSFQSSGLNISMINDSSSGIYSLIYSVPLSSVSQLNSLLGSLRYNPAQDYSNDISIGVSLADGLSGIFVLYNLIILTCTNPISTQTAISSNGSRTSPSATTETSFNSVTPASALTTIVNSATSKNSDQLSTMMPSTSSQLIPIIGGSVVGGLLVMGSMVFVVVAFVRSSHGKRIKYAAQKDNQNFENQAPGTLEPGNINPGSQSIPVADSSLMSFQSARFHPISNDVAAAAPTSGYVSLPTQTRIPAVQREDSNIIPRQPYFEIPKGDAHHPYVNLPNRSHYETYLPLFKKNYEAILSTIHKAAESGDCYLIQLHLGFGVPVDLLNDAGYTPLHLAIMAGQEEVCKLLLACGANKNLLTKDDKTARMLAQEVNNHSIRALLENSQPTSKNHYGPLSPKESGYQLFSRSSVKEANVSEVDIIWTNTLHTAAQSGLCQLIVVYLELGVPVDLLNEKGLTALHVAAQAGQEEVCRLLIYRGAHMNLQTKDGRTAAMLARDHGHSLLALMLEQASSAQNGHPT